MLLEDALRAVRDRSRLRRADRRRRLGRRLAGDPARGLRFPTREVTLLEAERRKCDFLERWAPPNARVVWGRAEEQETERYGVALAKALAQPPVAAEWCLPLVRPGGAAVLWLGPSADPERRSPRVGAGSAAALPEEHDGLVVLPEGRADAAGLPAPRGRREEASARLIGCVPLRRQHPGLSRQWRRGRIYALANQKGGVGKTTTAINLAACLAEAGERALVIDLDPQANATSGLGMRANGTSSYDLLDGAPLARARRSTRRSRTSTSSRRSRSSPARSSSSRSAEDGERYLAQALASGTSQYDFVFLDCPPSLGPLTVNALAAADRVLVPVQAEYYALEGLTQLMQSIDLIRRRLNPSLGIGGVLLTMVDARTRLAQDVEAEVRQALRPARLPARRCRARCASPRRRATGCPRLPTTAARPAPTPTGRWRWSLSSAPNRRGASAAASRCWSAARAGAVRAARAARRRDPPEPEAAAASASTARRARVSPSRCAGRA